MKRIRTFCILLFVMCTLTSCWSRDDPWHPYYYKVHEIDAEIIATYETEPSNEYLLIPDTGYRFILGIEGEVKEFKADEIMFHTHKKGDTIRLKIEKKYRKDNDKYVDTNYYFVE